MSIVMDTESEWVKTLLYHQCIAELYVSLLYPSSCQIGS